MPVNDADRQIAADCVRKGVSQPIPEQIIDGNYDHWFFVQAFAAHREQAERDTIKAVVDWLRDKSSTPVPEGLPHAWEESAYNIRASLALCADALETGAWKPTSQPEP